MPKPVALVTGAAGFIGSHLTDLLLSRGYRVMGVDNLSTGREENLAHLKHEPDFHLVEHDLCKPLALKERFSWIFHFASPASPPRYLERPLETLRVNAVGTDSLLELAYSVGAHFFLASTSEVYGDPLVHPQKEEYWGNVNPVGSRSVYDEGKRYAEALTMAWHRRYGVPVRIVRIFNTYGPRMDPEDGRVVSNFIVHALRHLPLTIYGDGSQTRSFMFITDLLAGIEKLMGVDYPFPLNLGNPREVTIRELAHILESLLGTPLQLTFQPLPEDDPRRRLPDIEKAKKLLGWEPVVPLEEGLKKTIAYFQEVVEETKS